MENEIRKTIRLSKEEYDVVESVREEKQLLIFQRHCVICCMTIPGSKKKFRVYSKRTRSWRKKIESK